MLLYLINHQPHFSCIERCVITYTDSTVSEDFYGKGADAKISSLKGITLDDLFAPLIAGDPEILAKQRDPKTPSGSAVAEPMSSPRTQEPVSSTPNIPSAEFYSGWTPHMMTVRDNPYTRPISELLKSE